MNKAIIVSHADNTAEVIQHILHDMGYERIHTTPVGSEARRLMLHTPPDMLIINTPLNDEFGTELAEFAAERSSSVILLCGRDIADDLADRLSPYNILVLSKPVTANALKEGILMIGSEPALFADIRESEEVLRRIDDIRLINRAKSMLMKYLGFTEPQAHRHLEKKAMNCRCTRHEASKKIISDLT